MSKLSKLDVRGIAEGRPTIKDKGISIEEDAMVERARVRGYALDFDPSLRIAPQSPAQALDVDPFVERAGERGYALDFVPRYDTPKRRLNGGVKAVQSDPKLTARLQNGPGLLFVGARNQNIAREQTVRAMEAVGRAWAARHPHGPRMRVGGIGNVYGGPLQRGVDKDGRPLFHKSHETGLDVDVRPMRQDGREADVTIFEKHYSRELTSELIRLFQTQLELPVHVIFFNDPLVPGVQAQEGHHNHFHVRFQMPR
jgi:hypothetical protein